MRGGTGHCMCGVVAGLLLVACQSVSGLDDLLFDGVGGQGGAPASTGTSAPGSGGSGAGGSGSGGQGGGPPPCTPPPAVACAGGVAVPPTIVAGATSGNVGIASAGGVFGIYVGASFMTLDGNGQIQPLVTGPYYPISQPRVSANAAGFAIAMHANLGNNDSDLGVVRFTLCGQEISTSTYLFNSFPVQADVTGVAGGFLISIVPGTPNNQKLHTSWLPDGQDGTPLTLVPPGGNVSCCAAKRWAAGVHAGSFYLAWFSATAEDLLTPISFSGVAGTTATITGQDIPTFVGSVNNELVVATPARVLRLGSNGAVLSESPLTSQSGCALATSGTQLRRACRAADDTIALTSVDPATGAETLLQTLVVTAAQSSPAIAWDGEGYGIAWRDTDGVAFARVCATP